MIDGSVIGLLAERVPRAVADDRRQRQRDETRRRGQMVSARTLTLADWTIRVTNVPAGRLTVAEAMVIQHWVLVVTSWQYSERRLAAGGRVNERRKRPNTCQVLQVVAA